IYSFNYLKKSNKETEANRLNEWLDDAKTQRFNHIFLVTFDAAWKKNEEALNGHLLWLPGIPSGDLYSKEMHAFIRGQVEQVGELFNLTGEKEVYNTVMLIISETYT